MPKERPILFSGAMVRAILEGRKTQTRRIMVNQPEPWKKFFEEGGCQKSDWTFSFVEQSTNGNNFKHGLFAKCVFHENEFYPCPYGKPGDKLWVREEYSFEYHWTGTKPKDVPEGELKWYWADGNPEYGDWTKPKPSIHLPRVHSRIDLLITGVRVERLKDISEADAYAEGVWTSAVVQGSGDINKSRAGANVFHYQPFQELWCEINGAESWDANPWVWCIAFERVNP